MCYNKTELQSYKSLNRIARKNSVVILGSTYMKQMPVGELRQIFGILSDIYNRSLTNLSVFETNEIVSEIMSDLMPKKIILQLGEYDLENNNASVDEVMEEISSIHSAIKKTDKTTKIVFVSLNNLTDKELQKEFNTRLETFAKKSKSVYADISSASDDDANRIQTFRLLRYFMTDDFSFRIM